MRDLAFIDPGPRLIQFLAAVGERLRPEFTPCFFSTSVKGRSLLARLGHRPAPGRARGRLAALPADVRIDPEALVTRLRARRDIALVRAGDPRYLWLVDSLARYVDAHDLAGIFMWNGSGLAAAIAEQLALARGVQTLFGENGYLPGTLQIDPAGVNAFSSIGRAWDSERIRALSFTGEQIGELDALLDEYRAGRQPVRVPPPGGRVRPSVGAYLLQAWADLFERPRPIKGNRLIGRNPAPPTRPFVFFPLQVKSDSQLTIHSPIYGHALESAVLDLRQALRALDPALTLVVKLHPADLTRTDYDGVARACPEVIWTAGGDVRPFLREAAAVVTINSTVGVEAMIFGKPVVALGRNFYVREGLVEVVHERTELPAALARSLANPPDAQLRAQFLRALYFNAFVRAHWADYSDASLANVAARIAAILQGRA